MKAICVGREKSKEGVYDNYKLIVNPGYGKGQLQLITTYRTREQLIRDINNGNLEVLNLILTSDSKIRIIKNIDYEHICDKYFILNDSLIEEIDCEKDLSFRVMTNLYDLRNVVYKSQLMGYRVTELAKDDIGNKVKAIAIERNKDIIIISTKKLYIAGYNKGTTFNKYTTYSPVFSHTLFTKIDLTNTNFLENEDYSMLFAEASAKVIDISNVDFKPITNANGLFGRYSGTIIGIENIDTSNMESMDLMFYNSKIPNVDISNFDLRKVKTMDMMFSEANIGKLIIGEHPECRCKNIKEMFADAVIKSRLDLRGVNFRSVRNADRAFFRLSLETNTLYLDNTDFCSLETADDILKKTEASEVSCMGIKINQIMSDRIRYEDIDMKAILRTNNAMLRKLLTGF